MAIKLALGTAQFGMAYGVTNKTGKVSLAETEKILQLALDSDINTLDTAVAYGNAEALLGYVLGGDNPFQIVTKLPPGIKPSCVEQVVQASLSRLNTNRLEGLLIHCADDLLGVSGDALLTLLHKIKQQGFCRKIGASVYCQKDFQSLVQLLQLDLCQAPLNLLDQRFIDKKVILQVYKRDISMHGRSLFLQGILVTPIEELPTYFHQFSHYLNPIFTTAKRLGVKPMSIAMAMVHLTPSIEKIVVGCCSAEQLRQQIDSYYQGKEIASQLDISLFACGEQALISPHVWPEAM